MKCSGTHSPVPLYIKINIYGPFAPRHRNRRVLRLVDFAMYQVGSCSLEAVSAAILVSLTDQSNRPWDLEAAAALCLAGGRPSRFLEEAEGSLGQAS